MGVGQGVRTGLEQGGHHQCLTDIIFFFFFFVRENKT